MILWIQTVDHSKNDYFFHIPRFKKKNGFAVKNSYIRTSFMFLVVQSIN